MSPVAAAMGPAKINRWAGLNWLSVCSDCKLCWWWLENSNTGCRLFKTVQRKYIYFFSFPGWGHLYKPIFFFLLFTLHSSFHCGFGTFLGVYDFQMIWNMYLVYKIKTLLFILFKEQHFTTSTDWISSFDTALCLWGLPMEPFPNAV